MFHRNLLLTCWMAVTTIAVWPTVAQANPQEKKNYIGPAIVFGSGQSILGVEGRFYLTNNISLRPAYSFANLSGTGVTVFGGSATYEFNLDDSQALPFVGLGMNFYHIDLGVAAPTSSSSGFAQVGMDLLVDKNIAITSDVKVPFSSNAVLGTILSIGAGYRF